MKNRDYYSRLQVGRSASAEEIRKAYRILAREYHPDLNPGSDAEERFKLLNEAYAVLSDEDKRQYYDHYGRAPGQRVFRGADRQGPRAGFGGCRGKGFGCGFAAGMRAYGRCWKKDHTRQEVTDDED